MDLDLARVHHSRCGGSIRGLYFKVQVELDRPNGGAGADVDHPDSALRLGEVNLFTLDHRPGERAGNGAHGGAVCGVDDSDTGSF
jgi:hypothetical protein